MTNTKEQNRKFNEAGFEGDHHIEAEIAKLCQQFKITSIIETGSQYGHTTKKLAKYGTTISCEIDKLNYDIAKQNLINKETGKDIAICFNCDSVALLKTNLKAMNNQRVLMYLDAHWNGTPLLNELVEIQKSGITPVIVIHDFKVPNHPELGFDSYNGQDYTFEWIKPYIDAIYAKNGYYFYYNETAEGMKRGVIYITPKVMETAIRTQEEINAGIAKHLTFEEVPKAGLVDLTKNQDSLPEIDLSQLSETPVKDTEESKLVDELIKPKRKYTKE